MNLKSFVTKPVFRKLSLLAEAENVKIFVIGGFVRDKILKLPDKHDVDLVVDANVADFAQKAADMLKAKNLTIYKRFGTAMFVYRNTQFEFVEARKESYSSDSRNPVVRRGTFADDQKRRDFTINALAISLNSDSYGEFSDPFNGYGDLEDRIIRTPSDPDVTFSDDPLRMLRAIRFATQLNFTIEPDCFESIRKNKERIQIVSIERVTTELNKILSAAKPSIGLKLLHSSGLLDLVFPELSALAGVTVIDNIAHKDNLLHTIEVVDNIARSSDNLWLRWAGLLHDIAKPKTRRYVKGVGWTFHSHNFFGAAMVPEIFARLRLPLNDKMKFVQKLVDLHMRPIALVEDVVTDSAVRRLIVDAGDDIDDLMTLCEADITSKNEQKVHLYLHNFHLVRQKIVDVTERDSLRNFQPPITGEEIMKYYNIPPSRRIGEIKNAIKDAILDGVIPNDKAAAFKFMTDNFGTV